MQISMRKRVKHMTREEIARECAEFFDSRNNVVNPTQNNQEQSLQNNSYISRIKIKELVKFLSKFGNVNSIYKFKDEKDKDFIYADCGKIKIYFSDFDFAIKYDPSYNENSLFDYKSFEEYCNSTDMPVEQAIADMIILDYMMPNFSSYAENLQKQRDKKSTQAFDKLPHPVKSAMKTVHQKQLADNNTMGNKGRYGTFDTESLFKNTFGSN